MGKLKFGIFLYIILGAINLNISYADSNDSNIEENNEIVYEVNK